MTFAGEATDWARVAVLLEELYRASTGLEAIFPDRKFTLDGHLVGSIGEVVAAYMFGLRLNPASTLGHDAIAADGRQVEIKLTQGKGIAIRHEPEHLIVLHRPAGGPVRVVFNGSGAPAWQATGKMQKNGQRPISLTRLRTVDRAVAASDRLPQLRDAPV
ncbi:MAG: hypothetical protein VYB54_00270 [Pseudomonadota bacterium]|nr:hypothetical protein [Pseudomonadota bacterium]